MDINQDICKWSCSCIVHVDRELWNIECSGALVREDVNVNVLVIGLNQGLSFRHVQITSHDIDIDRYQSSAS